MDKHLASFAKAKGDPSIPPNTAATQAITSGQFPAYSGPGCNKVGKSAQGAIGDPFKWLDQVISIGRNVQDPGVINLKRLAPAKLDCMTSALILAYKNSLSDEELVQQFLKDIAPFARVKLIHAHLSVAAQPNKSVGSFLNEYIDASRPHWSLGLDKDDDSWMAIPALKVYAVSFFLGHYHMY
ncbi:hypothetical protein BCR44DRAFT_1505933 [Catenaria anguillulae PL171]|uniref:Uncharacterized protein n=1 Tax=Catenaria anguillulae PL171 TaxID=765915 RepID=A0A1Y2H648_9FUNG|nr:hypothetical protein BCR44DRAFT_1505933 [Catenaria anguillulae PL171]